MKLYLLFYTAAVALACVSCLTRNGGDARAVTADHTKKPSSFRLEPRGQHGW